MLAPAAPPPPPKPKKTGAERIAEMQKGELNEVVVGDEGKNMTIIIERPVGMSHYAVELRTSVGYLGAEQASLL